MAPLQHHARFFYGAIICSLLVACFAPTLTAQDPNFCGSEAEEIPWLIPPAVAAISGDPESFDPGIVLTGDRLGTLRLWDLEFGGTLSQRSTLEPGSGLPDDVAGIWDIDVLADGSVIALVTYRDAGNEWYGVIKSTDLETWTLEKPAALQVAHFQSIEGKGRQISTRRGPRRLDYTGNYWRAPLYEMEWLGDAKTGWMWGRNGVAMTTDGGLTWTVKYQADVSVEKGVGDNVQIWGLAMKSPTEGTAVMGGTAGTQFYATTDGGTTWNKGFFPLGINRLADLDAVGGEFRAIIFNDAAQGQANTQLIVSTDGKSWEVRKNEKSWIISESVYATDAIWTSSDDGFLIQRQGEIWRTEDGGRTWSQTQDRDDQYDTVLYGDGTSISGTGAPPFFPYAGYGQRDAVLKDAFGDAYMVNVISDTCVGDIRSYIPVWPVSDFSSVPDEKRTNDLNLVVRPNPTSDRCQVTFNLTKSSRLHLSVVNSLGEVVDQQSYARLEAGEHQVEVSLQGLPEGAYRVTLRSNEGDSSSPIVVTR